MNKTFVIADLHFSHENIIKYENRPFRDVEHMNSFLIANWNRVVKKHDTVFVLGDVSFTGKEETKELVGQLNGKKILIMGNHDRGRSPENFWKYVGFDEVYRYPIVYREFLVLSHEPPTYFNDATPFAWIYGHVHGTDMYQTVTRNTACVSVERWNYIPVDLDWLIKAMEEQNDKDFC